MKESNNQNQVDKITEDLISARTLLDSMPGNVALLDREGNIIEVNDRWIKFSQQNNGQLSDCSLGINYLQVCESAYQKGCKSAKLAAEGIKAVIKGKKEVFEFEYPCHSPDQKRWFNMRVTSLTDTAPNIVGVFHFDITERKLAEEKAQQKTEQLTQRIEEARKIHQTLLPAKELELTDLKAAICYQPAEDLGGDFFNFQQVDDKLVFYLVDVSGHGLDGAMLNLLVQQKLDNYFTMWMTEKEKYFGYDWLLESKSANKHLCPRQIIAQVHDLYIRKQFPADYFLCIEVGIIALKERELIHSNAGFHIAPVYLSSTGELTSLTAPGAPISEVVPFNHEDLTEKRTNLEPGGKLLFTTDGLIEVSGKTNRYGTGRLYQVLKDNYYLDCELLKEVVVKDLLRFHQGKEVADDITFVVIEIKEEDRFTTSLASDFSVLEPLKQEVKEFLAGKIDDIDLVVIGLQEIVANAIEHGNEFSKHKQVEIEVVVRSDYLRVAVVDEGSGFGGEDCLERDIDLTDFTDRGRGIALAKEAVDEVYYNCPGNRVNLIKFIE